MEFIHEQHVAHRYATAVWSHDSSKFTFHRDVGRFNVMMDLSIFPEPPHPVTVSRSYDFKRRVRPWTRTSRPPKYYIIDFGISTYFDDPVGPYLVTGSDAQDHSIPELSDTIPYDPFLLDIYALGNVYRKTFLKVNVLPRSFTSA